VFTELAWQLLAAGGRAGLVVPSNVATDDTTKVLFQALVQERALVSLFDFENRQKLFPAVDSRMKFCLLTLTQREHPEPARFAFFLERPEELRDETRCFALMPKDFWLLNPNTGTCPVFRSADEAELARAIYRRVPVLVREDDPDGNPWGVEFMAKVCSHGQLDSDLFRRREQLERAGFALRGNVFARGEERYLPLYEAKLVHQFDHRWASYGGPGRWEGEPETGGPPWLEHAPRKDDDAVALTLQAKQDPSCLVLPRYWVAEAEVEARLARKGWSRPWLLGWRDITNATNERTVIASLIPRVGVGDTVLLLFPGEAQADIAWALLANLDALVLDFIARNKAGGTQPKILRLQATPRPPARGLRPPLPLASRADAGRVDRPTRPGAGLHRLGPRPGRPRPRGLRPALPLGAGTAGAAAGRARCRLFPPLRSHPQSGRVRARHLPGAARQRGESLRRIPHRAPGADRLRRAGRRPDARRALPLPPRPTTGRRPGTAWAEDPSSR
jgi:hypothetical protein